MTTFQILSACDLHDVDLRNREELPGVGVRADSAIEGYFCGWENNGLRELGPPGFAISEIEIAY